MEVWRPADLMETAVAWYESIKHHTGPSSLLLSRQNLPALKHAANAVELISKGGYILEDCEGWPEAIIIATGSEVQLALAAARQLNDAGRRIRVVSIPCCERFLQQDATWQEHVLPNSVRKRVAIEAAASAYWYRFVGLDGRVLGLDRFGVSAPAAQAFEYLGITLEKLITCLENELL